MDMALSFALPTIYPRRDIQLVDPMVQRCCSAREGYIGFFLGAKKNKSARLESSFCRR